MSGRNCVYEGPIREHLMADFIRTIWMGMAQNGGKLVGAIEAVCQECAGTWEAAHAHNMSHRQQWERDVLDRAGWRCEGCKKFRPLSVHHVQFKGRGGPDSAANGMATCVDCHAKAHGIKVAKDEQS
jgi:hypothetical protein